MVEVEKGIRGDVGGGRGAEEGVKAAGRRRRRKR